MQVDVQVKANLATARNLAPPGIGDRAIEHLLVPGQSLIS